MKKGMELPFNTIAVAIIILIVIVVVLTIFTNIFGEQRGFLDDKINNLEDDIKNEIVIPLFIIPARIFRNKKGFFSVFTARVIIGIAVILIAAPAGARLAGVFFDQVGKSYDEFVEKIVRVSDGNQGDFLAHSIKLKEDNAIVAFAADSDKIMLTDKLEHIHQTFLPRPGVCDNGPCICFCEKLERSGKTIDPFELTCINSRCQNLPGVNFPSNLTCEEMGDTGDIPFQSREKTETDAGSGFSTSAVTGCFYSFEGGFMLGSSRTIPKDIIDYPNLANYQTPLFIQKTQDSKIIITGKRP